MAPITKQSHRPMPTFSKAQSSPFPHMPQQSIHPVKFKFKFAQGRHTGGHAQSWRRCLAAAEGGRRSGRARKGATEPQRAQPAIGPAGSALFCRAPQLSPAPAGELSCLLVLSSLPRQRDGNMRLAPILGCTA